MRAKFANLLRCSMGEMRTEIIASTILNRYDNNNKGNVTITLINNGYVKTVLVFRVGYLPTD